MTKNQINRESDINIAPVGNLPQKLPSCREQKARSAAELGAIINAVLEKTNIGIGVLDRDLRFIMANEYLAVKINKMALNDMVGKSLQEVLATKYEPSVVEHLVQLYIKVLETGISEKASRWPELGKHERYLDLEISRISDEDGNITGLLVIIADVTKRIRLESLMRKKNHRLARVNTDIIDILENASDGFHSLDSEGRFSYLNRVAVQHFQSCTTLTSKEDLIGKRIGDIVPLIPIFDEMVLKVKNTKSPAHFEFFSPIAKGWLSMSIFPLSDGGLAFYFRNIDEQKRIQQEMARLDQLHLVGEMAAGISHEIRNPMTTVRGYLQMLRAKDRVPAFSEQFDLMIQELDRANHIISEFLSLASNKIVERNPVFLVEVIKAIIPLIESDAHLAGKNIKIQLQEVPLTLLDPKEIRQLILNLTRNGLEAMPAGGTLNIATYMDNNRIVLSVQDEGQGIPNELIHKLGTPFCTTKENGTGLGLAICYSIAQRHGASIGFKTGSHGTTFLVRFKTHD